MASLGTSWPSDAEFSAIAPSKSAKVGSVAGKIGKSAESEAVEGQDADSFWS